MLSNEDRHGVSIISDKNNKLLKYNNKVRGRNSRGAPASVPPPPAQAFQQMKSIQEALLRSHPAFQSNLYNVLFNYYYCYYQQQQLQRNNFGDNVEALELQNKDNTMLLLVFMAGAAMLEEEYRNMSTVTTKLVKTQKRSSNAYDNICNSENAITDNDDGDNIGKKSSDGNEDDEYDVCNSVSNNSEEEDEGDDADANSSSSNNTNNSVTQLLIDRINEIQDRYENSLEINEIQRHTIHELEQKLVMHNTRARSSSKGGDNNENDDRKDEELEEEYKQFDIANIMKHQVQKKDDRIVELTNENETLRTDVHKLLKELNDVKVKEERLEKELHDVKQKQQQLEQYSEESEEIKRKGNENGNDDKPITVGVEAGETEKGKEVVQIEISDFISPGNDDKKDKELLVCCNYNDDTEEKEDDDDDDDDDGNTSVSTTSTHTSIHGGKNFIQHLFMRFRHNNSNDNDNNNDDNDNSSHRPRLGRQTSAPALLSAGGETKTEDRQEKNDDKRSVDGEGSNREIPSPLNNLQISRNQQRSSLIANDEETTKDGVNCNSKSLVALQNHQQPMVQQPGMMTSARQRRRRSNSVNSSSSTASVPMAPNSEIILNKRRRSLSENIRSNNKKMSPKAAPQSGPPTYPSPLSLAQQKMKSQRDGNSLLPPQPSSAKRQLNLPLQIQRQEDKSKPTSHRRRSEGTSMIQIPKRRPTKRIGDAEQRSFGNPRRIRTSRRTNKQQRQKAAAQSTNNGKELLPPQQKVKQQEEHLILVGRKLQEEQKRQQQQQQEQELQQRKCNSNSNSS